MTRDEACQLLTKYLHNKNLLKHSLAAEEAMKALARKLEARNAKSETSEAEWGMTGLLHDIDYEIAQKENKLDQHGLLIFEKEADLIPQNIVHAIKSHNYKNTKVLPKSKMDWAIVCCDQLTGLIVAAALISPQKKLNNIDADFVLKRMKEKSFAKGADREPILLCEEKLGIPLKEFVEIVLSSMQQIHEELGL